MFFFFLEWFKRNIWFCLNFFFFIILVNIGILFIILCQIILLVNFV